LSTGSATKTGRTAAIAVVVIIVIAAAAAGWYLYSRAQGSHTSTTTTTPAPLYARIDTSMGSMEIELFPASAPKTVANFVQLVDSGFYTQLVWHRIVKGFVIQTGDPNTRGGGGNESTWGTGGSSQTVPLEIDPNLHNYAGYLGMAHTSTSTFASSQFYINLANNTALDGGYTVFAKVISGMNTAYAIGNVPVNSKDIPKTLVFVTDIVMLSGP
jgi:dolichyl-diphosphooligosaccharide---protein glycosyltransferase